MILLLQVEMSDFAYYDDEVDNDCRFFFMLLLMIKTLVVMLTMVRLLMIVMLMMLLPQVEMSAQEHWESERGNFCL